MSNSSSSAITAGTATPVTLVVKVTDAAGKAVSGATVSWSSSGGTITSSSVTDAGGQASAQWTPGTAAGNEGATAVVTGVAGSASFSVQIVAGALAKVKITPDTVKLTLAGDTLRVTAAGADTFDNAVSVSSFTFTTDNPTIATVNSTGLVTAVNPGVANISAASGSANGKTVAQVKGPPCLGNPGLTLVVGQVTTLSGTAAAEICVQGSAGAEFVAIPFFPSLTGAGISLTINPVGTTATVGPPTPSVGTTSALRKAILSDGRELVRDVEWESQFREASLRELNPRIGSARAAMQQSSNGMRSNVSMAVLAPGDLIDLNVNSTSCSVITNHTAQVMSVSNNAIVLNDTQNPGGFTQADWDFFAAAFDTLVVPVDTTNFGAPTDIDGNGHVLLLFTTEVNKLTLAGSSSFVGGFFSGRDIFPKTAQQRTGSACAASNAAEMFYLLAPDPAGTINGNVRSASFVRGITVGTIAHEFQHLINASRHLYVNTNTTQFETSFLDEGLAHIAEELTFYRASGLSSRTNIDAATILASQTRIDAANNYAVQNQRRFREYLKVPETNSLYNSNDDLSTRGATWSFLRYASDRKGGIEKNTWFQLVNVNNTVNGQSPVGLANLTQVFGADLASQMRDYAVANYVDDAVAGVPAVNKHLSWNQRSVEAQVSGGTYPLKTQQLTPGNRLSLTLIDGGSTYLRFGVGAGVIGGAAFTASGISSLPAALSVSIIRTK